MNKVKESFKILIDDIVIAIKLHFFRTDKDEHENFENRMGWNSD